MNKKDEKSDNRIIKSIVTWKEKYSKKSWIKYKNEKMRNDKLKKMKSEKWKMKKKMKSEN